jgi:hypothetical protein
VALLNRLKIPAQCPAAATTGLSPYSGFLFVIMGAGIGAGRVKQA